MDEQCSKCKFFLLKTKREGWCRRYPRTVVEGSSGNASQIDSDTYNLFPVVDTEDWCGEFKIRSEVV